MPTQTISMAIAIGSETFNLTKTVTDVQARAVDVTLAPAAVNTEVDLVLTNAQVDSLVLSCIGGDLTIKTNSTGSPNNTVVMANGDLLLWSTTAGIGVNPFITANITKLYLSSTAGTVFKLRAVVTATNG